MSLIGNPDTPASYVADYMQACVGMFGIPAGGFTSDIETYGAATSYDVESLYAAMLNSTIGRSIYAPGISNESFATKLVDKVGGSLLSDADKAAAIDEVQAMLDGGLSQAATAMAVVEFVAGLETSDETYGAVAQQFQNRIEIANYYTFSSTNPSSTMSTLAAILSSVDNETDVSDPAAVLEENTDPGVSTGQSYSLTSGIDTIVGTTGADTFTADSSALGAADTITGGAGTDTANMFISDDESINASGVELWNINASAAKTFNFAGVTDATTIVSKSSADLDVTNIKSNVTLGAVGTTGHDATDDFLVTFASGAVGSTTGTLSLEVDGAGTKGGTRFEFDVSVASTATESFSTLNVKGSNNASYIEVDDATAGSLALTKVVFTGGAMVDLGDAPSNFANVATVDASAATGGTKIDLATSSNAKDVTFTGGTGDDTVVFAAAGFTVADKIAGGDGTGDAIFTGDAVFTATTDAVVKAFNNANTTGIEIAGSTVTAVDGVQFKASVFSNINTFAFGSGGLTPAANAANAAGDVAATLTGIEEGDTFVILGDIIGGTSAAGDSNGGDAINATPLVNSGSDTLNLVFKAGAATAVTGGAAVDATDDDNEVNGDGLDASTIEKINITTNSAQDDVTFRDGATADVATTSADIKVGANATITITGAGDVDLGTIAAPSTDADDLTIDGSAMTGKLTLTTGAGNDIIKGGSKGDAITWGAGTNTATGNGGSDTYNVAAGNAVGAQDKVTDFTAGSGGDKLDLIAGSDTKSYNALTSAEQTAVDAEATLAAAVDTALAGATNSQWTAFTYGGKTYAVYDTDNTFDTTNGYLVELTGVTVANLTADNFA